MLIDSHCHLNYPGLVEREAEVLQHAADAGVGAMISISTRRDEWADVVAGAHRHRQVFATVGVHPHEADSHGDVDVTTLLAAADDPKVVGLGETGLDYHYNKSGHAEQQRLFRAHIAAARETGLPLVIHTRDAEADTIAILRDELEKGQFSMVIHCFTGSRSLAESCLEMGACISLSGIVTFKNAADLRETARIIPDDRLLVETDSPFLAPVPMRGKTCEPAYVAHTARFLADLRGADPADFIRVTGENVRRLFAKMAI